MAQYMTAQRRELFSFLRSHPDRHYSAREIADSLGDSQISLSAVYRNLSALEQAGYITRVIRAGSRESCYQCLDCADCRDSLHLTCTCCGRAIHMDGGQARRMVSAVLEQDGFQVDLQRSVLYGVCKACAPKP